MTRVFDEPVPDASLSKRCLVIVSLMFSEGGKRIRASQGHSILVDLQRELGEQENLPSLVIRRIDELCKTSKCGLRFARKPSGQGPRLARRRQKVDCQRI